MTSRPNNQGFTFLEIALALGIIAVVFVAVLPVVAISSQERRLRGTLDEITQCVRDLRLEAEATGTGQVLILSKAGVSERDGSRQRDLIKLPKGITLSVKFPQGEWEPADGQRWNIFSSGLVAPLSLRVQERRNWIEADFDFLTGSVADERYSL